MKHNAYFYLDRVIKFSMYICSWGALLSMLTLIGVGLYSIFKGCLMFFKIITHEDQSLTHEAAALESAIRGLEFLFLAPLVYLLLLSVTRYLVSMHGSSSHESGNNQPLKARSDLLIVKAFNITLIIAVIAASLMGRAISVNGLTYENTLCGVLLIIVLVIYVVIQEKIISNLNKEIIGKTSEENN